MFLKIKTKFENYKDSFLKTCFCFLNFAKNTTLYLNKMQIILRNWKEINLIFKLQKPTN